MPVRGRMTDREKLLDFLNKTEEVLELVVYKWSILLFPAKWRQPLRDAWEDPVHEQLEEVQDEISHGPANLNTRYRQAGLTGNALQVKMLGFWNAWDAFKHWGSVKLLKRLLKWINTILGSLSAVLPLTEAVKELKEVVELLMDDEDVRWDLTENWEDIDMDVKLYEP